MKRNAWLIGSLSLCLLTYAVGTAHATGSIRTAWKNYYPTACSTLRSTADSCLLCHTTTPADIDNLNSYALLLQSNNRNFGAAESVDSDGDGRTNGQEILLDCTRPGDATSPTADLSWGTIKSTYR